jgi:hypothetical protein
MSEGFVVDNWVAMLFFRICRRYNVQSREDRVFLMRELARRKKARYIRDIKPLLTGKRVLQVGFKPPHNAGPEHTCPECKPKEPK